MPCLAVEDMAAGAKCHHLLVDLGDVLNALLAEHLKKPPEHMRHGDAVVHGTVVVEFRQAQGVGHDVELVVFEVWQQILRQDQSIHIGGLVLDAQPAAGRQDKAHVEVGIVGREGQVAAEL